MPRYEEADGGRSGRVIAGEGMLVATVDGYFVDGYGRHEIKAGISRIAADHPLASRRPDAFRVAWRQDVLTAKQHRANLRARMGELHGEPARRATPTTRPAWWIG